MFRRLFRRVYTRLYATLNGVRIGRGVWIRPGARVRREGGGAISIGDHCHIHPGAMILTNGGDIRIGSHTSVNAYSMLYGQGGLEIGSKVRIAAHCVLIPANHGFEPSGVPISDQPETRRGIRIMDDVWLGAGVCVLDGCVIESGCVVAAGAVARGDLRANGVYGGVPVRLIRMR